MCATWRASRRRRRSERPERAHDDPKRATAGPAAEPLRWTRACCASTATSSRTCARSARSSRASSRRSRRASAWKAWRSPTRTSSACSKGFAFLTARVQLKLEAEQPRLIAHLLEATYPNFLAPMPSMLVARFGVDPADPNLVKGYVLPRGSALTSELARGQDTHCAFTTGHAVTLWPIELTGVQYFTHAPDLAAAKLPQLLGTRGGLRIRLRCRRRRELRSARRRPPGLLHQRRRRRRVSHARAAPRRGERHARARRSCRRRGRRRAAVARPRKRSRPRLRRRRGAAAGVAARLLGLSADPGSRGDAAAPALLRDRRSRRAARRGPWRRGRADRAAAARRSGARGAGRRREPRALLHAGDQPLPEAPRPHPGRHRLVGIPRRSRPHPADGLRGAQHRLGDRLRHRPRRAAGVRSALRDLPRRCRADWRRGARLLHGASRAALALGAPEAARRALLVHRRGGLSLARRSAPRAVPRRHPPALGLGVGDQPRPADTAAARGERRGAAVAPRVAGPGRARRRAARADAAGDAPPGRTARLEPRQPPDAQPSRARRRDAAARRGSAARHARALCAPGRQRLDPPGRRACRACRRKASCAGSRFPAR